VVATETEDAIWDAYNLLLGGSDLERIRKMLVRYEIFRKTIDIPGDIVEAGVFKGTCLLYFLKLLAIHCPGSVKRVVGFDLFAGWSNQAGVEDKPMVDAYLAEAHFTGTTPAAIYTMVHNAGFDANACELVAGDIGETAAQYVETYPGFRISLLNLDLDLSVPTLAALDALWPRVVRGGIVIFDEYAVARWSASQGIDAWLANRDLRLKTLPWGRSPTAYLIKP
jgi:hypothetical protein